MLCCLPRSAQGRGQGAQGPVLGLAGELIWPVTDPAWVGPDPPVAFLRARHERRCPGGTGGWRHRLTSCMAQVAAAADLRRVARARFTSTATVAATSAAAAAIRAICQPGMPPTTTVWSGAGAGAWCT